MGWCHEFGPQIQEDGSCRHPMRAGATACQCPECGVVCKGRFEACPDVWAAGPKRVTAMGQGPAPSVAPEPNGDAPKDGGAVAPASAPPPPKAGEGNLASLDQVSTEIRALARELAQQRAVVEQLVRRPGGPVNGVAPDQLESLGGLVAAAVEEALATRQDRTTTAKAPGAMAEVQTALASLQALADELRGNAVRLDALDAIMRRADHRLTDLNQRLSELEARPRSRRSKQPSASS